MEPKQVPSLWVSAGQGVIAMKSNLHIPQVPELEPHHQKRFSIISKLSPVCFLPLFRDTVADWEAQM